MDTKKRVKWDVYNEQCPTRLLLDRIADKWSVLIVGRLQQNTFRFNELKRAIPGITQKMLTQTLKSLERDGIVYREVYATVPPKVEYSLTSLGCNLTKVLHTLGQWAELNIEHILKAQKEFAKKNSC